MGSQWVEHYQVTNTFTFNLLIISSLEQNFSVFHLYGEKCLDLLEFSVKSASEGLKNIVLSLKSSHILEHEDGEGWQDANWEQQPRLWVWLGKWSQSKHGLDQAEDQH